MAGVGEAGAIVGLISTAATLSKAVIDIASKYKVARLQIESLCQEVGILGNILGQLHHLYKKDDLRSDEGVISLIADILNQCSGLFAELGTYRDALYSKKGSVPNIKFLGKAKWVFEEKELEYLRTRVESMKTNMLLMMTMQCVHGLQRSNVGGTVENHAEHARILSIQSQECAKRLQTLRNDEVLSTSTDANPVINRTSIDTAVSVRSITDSILSLYGHESLYGTPSESEGEVLGTRSMQIYQARVSRTIEDYIRKSPIINLDRPGSPLISPRTSQFFLDPSTASNDKARQDSPLISHCTSKYSLVSRTLSNDEAIGILEVEYFDHLAATELGILTDFCGCSSDHHRYDSERIASGFSLRVTRGVTLKESYVQAVSFFDKTKDWGCSSFSITLPRRVRHLHSDERPMMIFDSLVRRLRLYDSFRLREGYVDPDKRAIMILDYLVRMVQLPSPFKLRWRGVLVTWAYVNYVLNNIEYTYLINRENCYDDLLAPMLWAVDDRFEPILYELCLSSHIKESTSGLSMDQQPLTLYQQWDEEGRQPFFLIRLKDVART